ncbi:hypothetical protein ACLKA7_013026 [Drosophila subpalustris]
MDLIKIYPPSEAMLQAFQVKFNDKSLIAAKKEFAAYLQNQQLSHDNISMVLKMLLSIEDISTMYVLAQLMETDVTVFKSETIDKHNISNIVYKMMVKQTIVNPEDVLTANIDELVLVPKSSLLASERPKNIILEQLPHRHENLKLDDPKLRHVGYITKVENTCITFDCNSLCKLQKFHKSEKFKVIFRSKRIPTRLMYEALDNLQASLPIRSYLFPSSRNKQDKTLHTSEFSRSNPFNLINASIAKNVDQLQAVKQIVAGPKALGPYIVFGPPGTGKTTTIVEAILQLCLRPDAKARIIVTAGSNSACDAIALSICECIERDKRFRYDRQSPNGVLLRVFSETRKREDDLTLVHPLVLNNSNWKFVKNSLNFKAYRIIVATLCKVGVMGRTGAGSVTHVFIDEAAASSEPESLLAIVSIKQLSNCHVILSGDPKQLGPVIKSSRASSLGLGKSLMDRLMGSELYKVHDDGTYDCTLQTRLRQNYRSHTEIVRLFNKLYYNNDLKALAPSQNVNRAANWIMLPNPKFPILFHATYGITKRHPLSFSSYNELEADWICWYVSNLLHNGLGNGVRVQQEDIGVISPYLAQCALLSQKLRDHQQGKVRVGTVEKFQGHEKPIIIASLVASFSGSAFVSDARRLNVLISRPKSLLLLIGNPYNLCQCEDLKFIIGQCQLHGHLFTIPGISS